MFHNIIKNYNTTNGTVDPEVGAELMGMMHSEATMIFWAVIAIVGVVGCIAYTTAIPSMKASGIRLILVSVVASAMFYVLPGIISDIKMACGW